MTDSEHTVFIVFQGLPHVWYNHGNGVDALECAQEEAGRLCEETQEPHTIMAVPYKALQGLVAKYHGVVIHSLDEALKEQEKD